MILESISHEWVIDPKRFRFGSLPVCEWSGGRAGLVARMVGEDLPRIYRTPEDRDGDWNGAIADPAVVEDAWCQWRAEAELTDRFIAGFADLGTRPGGDVQLRDILVAQIAEYARHCGHADLLRERIDGRVGQ